MESTYTCIHTTHYNKIIYSVFRTEKKIAVFKKLVSQGSFGTQADISVDSPTNTCILHDCILCLMPGIKLLVAVVKESNKA